MFGTLHFKGTRTALALLCVMALFGGSAPASAADQVIKIGLDFSVSGADTADDQPPQFGAMLAIEEANKNAPKGFHFEPMGLDDAVAGIHNPQQGATNIRAMIADPAVLAVVGPGFSNVSAATIPLTNPVGLVQITTQATNPTLTKTPKYRTAYPDRPNYFRVCATDDLQGEADAAVAKSLHLERVYIIDDNETYGRGLAEVFEKKFRGQGGTVLGHDHVTAQQQDFKALLTKIASMAPQAIFFGGTTSTGGGLIRQQMPGSGLDSEHVAFLGGDGLNSKEFVKLAGAAADNVYYTVASPHLGDTPRVRAFEAAYRSHFHADLGAYSANGYVAAHAVIAAIESAIKKNGGNLPSRVQVLDAMRQTKIETLIGPLSFDKNGDTTNPVFSVMHVKDGKQVFMSQLTVKV
ncbi:branched-chain amino acid ABC transporter substrate-binding protein [bacterium]|nr:MAG: branched-chain amino acid ABC transporter substrate-binding protein [bacterium]